MFTVTVAATEESLAAAEALVMGMAPSARRTYALGGTLKYELPIDEVTLSKVRDSSTHIYVLFYPDLY